MFLRDIWPSRTAVNEVAAGVINPKLFQDFYSTTLTRNQRWNNLVAPTGDLFEWTETSTYIHYPPFFKGMPKEVSTEIPQVVNASCLAVFGDSITTDHISPAGNISKTSPAAKFLVDNGVEVKDFNSYGARRGNDEVMARGTFANVRLINKMVEKPGPFTTHVPTGQVHQIYDAAMMYKSAGTPVIILAGQEYGSGSSRDWAAKGPFMQGVKAVIAQSFERIHRSNLLGMGILPTEFLKGQSPESLGLTGHESFTFDLSTALTVGQIIKVTAVSKDGSKKEFEVKSRLDTEPEIAYYMNGGILRYVLRKLI